MQQVVGFGAIECYSLGINRLRGEEAVGHGRGGSEEVCGQGAGCQVADSLAVTAILRALYRGCFWAVQVGHVKGPTMTKALRCARHTVIAHNFESRRDSTTWPRFIETRNEKWNLNIRCRWSSG